MRNEEKRPSQRPTLTMDLSEVERLKSQCRRNVRSYEPKPTVKIKFTPEEIAAMQERDE